MRYFLALLLTFALVTPALAAFTGPGGGTGGVAGAGGFQGPTANVSVDTVKKALSAMDDTPVLLTGQIVERLAGSNDKYTFKDATGQMTVEIDHEIFVNRNVTPQNTVRLSGKVDHDMGEPMKVDVKMLEIVQ